MSMMCSAHDGFICSCPSHFAETLFIKKPFAARPTANAKGFFFKKSFQEDNNLKAAGVTCYPGLFV